MTLDHDDDIGTAAAGPTTGDSGARSGASGSEPEEIEIAEIRADIEETRVEMGGTLSALGDRLDPGTLMNQAKQNVREATVGRVEETAKGMSEMVMETIRRNPIPAAMAGAGLALLWMNRSSGATAGDATGRYGASLDTPSGVGREPAWRERRDGIGDTAGQAIGAVGDNVGTAVGQAGETAQRLAGDVADHGQHVARDVGSRVEQFMRASPLAVGAIAAGAGALVGALVPETQKERQVIGDASQQAHEVVRDTISHAGDIAESRLDDAEAELAASGSGTSGG